MKVSQFGMVAISILISGLTAIYTGLQEGKVGNLLILNAVLQMFICLRASLDPSPQQQKAQEQQEQALADAIASPPDLALVIKALNDNPAYYEGILKAILNSHLKDTVKF
jgi:hypothetical protein